jgi:putative membrane protein
MKLSGLGVYLRGIAMGAADLVPGVSGGTVALITGIYGRLISAIASVGIDILSLVLRGRIAEAYKAIDGNFLLLLAAGIGTAIVGFAAILNWLLLHYPLPLWATFSGLVLASALSLVKQNYRSWRLRDWSFFTIGVAVAVSVGLTQAIQMPLTPLGIFFAGSIAISAMILPGISGSFLLLLMGVYQPIIAAVVNLELVTLALFALGCGVGLIFFSKLLQRLLAVAEKATIATLFGFLLGSLVILWPWQVTVSSVVDRHGDIRAVQTLPVSPTYYAQQVGDSMLLLCIACFIVGVVAVRLFMSLSENQRAD